MKKINLSNIPSSVEDIIKDTIIADNGVTDKLSNLSQDDMILLIVIFALILESQMDTELLLCILYVFLDKDFDFDLNLFSFQ